jgi:tetratricopeptide (TPR) repeat protein
MGLQQQRQQPDNAQDYTHAHKAVPWMRWLIAAVILLLIAVGIIIWILIDQSSWTTILPVVIFTVLGVVIALFQWLFPVSTGTHTHEHTANSFPASLMPQLSAASPAVSTMPQIIVHVPPADHMSLPQSGPLDKAPYRGIMGVPPPTDPRTIQQREKAVRDVYAKLTQSDISAIALTGIGGVGKSTLAALVYRYAEEQRRAGNGPFTAEAIWLNVDPAATMADLAGNLFELFGKPLPDFSNLSLQHQAMALFNVLDTADRPRIIVLDQFENLLDWQTGHALPDRPGVGEWLDAINSQPCTCRILLTSRPWPQGTREYPPTCMQEYFVQGLEPTEGIELLKKLHIEASETDLRTVVERCQGHAFALTLLASLLRNRNLGLAAFFKDPIYAQIWSGNVARNLLDYIYRQQLNEEQRKLLLAFSVYREPVPLAAAQALADFSSEVPRVQVQSALDALLAQHLLQASGDGRYQLHALVASYAENHFDESNDSANKAALRAARIRAAHYYLQQAATSSPPPEKRRQISDVQPLIEAIWQFCQSRQWQTAFDLMEKEKLFTSLKSWGCNAVLLELYQLLLPSNKWQPDPLHTAFIYNDLGIIYRVLWRLDRAREYLEHALSISKEIGEHRMTAWALNNLGRVYADSGNKEHARECYQEALEIFREEKDRNGEGATFNNLETHLFHLANLFKYFAASGFKL